MAYVATQLICRKYYIRNPVANQAIVSPNYPVSGQKRWSVILFVFVCLGDHEDKKEKKSKKNKKKSKEDDSDDDTGKKKRKKKKKDKKREEEEEEREEKENKEEEEPKVNPLVSYESQVGTINHLEINLIFW